MIIPPILTTPLIYFSLKGWENVIFELGSERVNGYLKIVQVFIFISLVWSSLVKSDKKEERKKKDVKEQERMVTSDSLCLYHVLYGVIFSCDSWTVLTLNTLI